MSILRWAKRLINYRGSIFLKYYRTIISSLRNLNCLLRYLFLYRLFLYNKRLLLLLSLNIWTINYLRGWIISSRWWIHLLLISWFLNKWSSVRLYLGWWKTLKTWEILILSVWWKYCLRLLDSLLEYVWLISIIIFYYSILIGRLKILKLFLLDLGGVLILVIIIEIIFILKNILSAKFYIFLELNTNLFILIILK